LEYVGLFRWIILKWILKEWDRNYGIDSCG
jgi:hypothetical protein